MWVDLSQKKYMALAGIYKLHSFNQATYPEAVSFLWKSVPVPPEVTGFFSRSRRSAEFAEEIWLFVPGDMES